MTRDSVTEDHRGPHARRPVLLADLSSRLHVSHIPVREALRRLEGEGLIELRRSRSGVVASLTAEDLDHVFHLRALIEGDMMARSVKQYTDAGLENLEAAYRALERRPNDTPGDLSARHTAFHRLLYAPAASRWDWRLYEILWHAGERYVYLVLGSTMLNGSPTHFCDVHTDLLEAARSRSVRLARKAVSDHLQAGTERVGAELAPRAGMTTRPTSTDSR